MSKRTLHTYLLLHQIEMMHINPWFWRFSLFFLWIGSEYLFFAELLYSIVYSARWVSMGLNLWSTYFGFNQYPSLHSVQVSTHLHWELIRYFTCSVDSIIFMFLCIYTIYSICNIFYTGMLSSEFKSKLISWSSATAVFILNDTMEFFYSVLITLYAVT